jgi:hypothetical protein
MVRPKEIGTRKPKRAMKAPHKIMVLEPEAESSEAAKSGEKLRLAELRKEIEMKVGTNSPLIVDGLIEAAKAGNLTQAKYLFEIIGLYPPKAGEEQASDETMVSMLLKRLGLPETAADQGSAEEEAETVRTVK